MLNNVLPTEELSGLARARARNYETKTVNAALVEQMVAEGWAVDKSNKKSVRLRRPKAHGTLLEDRVWTLLYRMQFLFLSGQGGAQLNLTPKDEKSAESQIDVVAIDNEVAIAIECKSSEEHSRRPQFQQELGKHTLIREPIISGCPAGYQPGDTRK